MMLLLVLLLSFAACAKGSVDDILDVSYEDEIKKLPCLLGMIKKHIYDGKRQYGSMITVSVPEEFDFLSQMIITELNENTKPKVSILLNDPMKQPIGDKGVHSKVECYVILCNSMREFSEAMKRVKSQPSWHPTASFMVIFLEMMSDFGLNIQTKSVMQELFDHSIVDVNVIGTRMTSHIIQSQTWYPYEGHRCGDAIFKVRTISECEYFGKEQSQDEYYYEEDKSEQDDDTNELFLLQYDFSNLGPKIPSDLNGCPIGVLALTLEPFVITDRNAHSGFEVMMTKVISEQLNLQPIIKYSDFNLAFKPLSTNNVSGFYADILNRKTDVMIGGMFDNSVNEEILSSSIPYVEDDYTWCVPKAKAAPEWLNIVSVFTLGTWTLAISSIFISALILYGFIVYEGKWKENFWFTLLVAVVVNVSISGPKFLNKVSPAYTRIFLVGLFLYGMNWNAAYTSYLFSVITNPRLKTQIHTVEEAIAEGFSFGGGENILEYIGTENALAQYITSHYQICPDINACLAELHSDEVLKAIATSRKHAISSRYVDSEQIFCFSKAESIHIHGIKLLVRKDFHLLPKLNDLVNLVTESGLFDKWQRDAVEAMKDDAPTKQAKIGTTGEAKPLQLRQIQGAFGLLLVGLTLATLIFAVEWTFFSLKSRKNSRLLNIIESRISV